VSQAAPVVFVVDDDESVRRSLARLIRSAGLEVQTFATPAAFLGHARPDRPACAVLDLRMPGSSGLAVQEALARTDADIPIVFLTGHADVSTSVRAMKAGAMDFLQKPLNEQDLLDAIQRALDRAKGLRKARAERELIEGRAATLTPREREVFALVVAGLPNKLVGDRLGAAEKTVKLHRARVMEKMKADSLADLVRMAQVVGLGPVPGDSEPKS
jgi:FixJ family two-component response regulator